MNSPSSISFDFRPATVADIPHLVPLWLEFMHFHSALDPRFALCEDAAIQSEKFMHEKLTDPAQFFLIAALESDNLPIAYIRAHLAANTPIFQLQRLGHIAELAVTAPHRNRGLGTQLLHRALAWLHDQNVEAIELTLLTANPQARRFWQKQNFTPLTERLRLTP